MGIQQLKRVMKYVKAPIQPFLQYSTIGYETQLIHLNPLCEKGDALAYQFHTDSRTDQRYLLVPDGCIDILFCCDALHPDAAFTGYHNSSTVCRLEPDTTYFGVKPYSGFLGLRRMNATPAELRERHLPLECLTGTGGLMEDLLLAESLEERAELFQAYFRRTCLDEAYASSLSGFISLELCCSGGNIPLEKLCEDTGYSSRYCRRVFTESYGLSIREYAQLLRIQRAMRELCDTDGSASKVACESGYCDEAHLINNFKSMIGMTPRQFRHQLIHAAGNVEWSGRMLTERDGLFRNIQYETPQKDYALRG